MHTYMYIYICVYTFIYIETYMCVCKYTYTYIYNLEEHSSIVFKHCCDVVLQDAVGVCGG